MSMAVFRMIHQDPEEVRGKGLDRDLVRRVVTLAAPYRWQLTGFLVAIVFEALLALVAPLVFKSIIDNTLPDQNTSLLVAESLLVVAAAVATAIVSLFERRWSARIGEGPIYDLRVGLFDHVQRMPMQFFTRSQTGALVSRLNNDVIGAQRAVTGTLGTVVSNVVTLVTVVIAMLALDWRITLASILLLPLFLLPSKRVGRRLQAMTRESFQLNAEMNATMTERFGVAGALLVKLFGRHETETDEFGERAARVRDIGIRSAVYTRFFMIMLTLVGLVGVAAVYLIGGLQVINGTITTGALVALAALVVRVYDPLTSLTNARVDVMSAFVSFERVFEVLDSPDPIPDPEHPVELVDPVGRIELDHVDFRYPAAGVGSIASLEVGGSERYSPDGPPLVLDDVTFTVEPGQRSRWSDHRARAIRPSPRSSPVSTTSRPERCASTVRTCDRCHRRASATRSAWWRRIPTCSTPPSVTTSVTPARRPRTRSFVRRVWPPRFST